MANGDDTQTQEKPDSKPSSPGIGEVISGQMLGASRGLGDILSAKMEADEPIRDQQSRQLSEDQARVRSQFEATRHSAEQLQPWDAERQSEKFSTDPLQAFGSVGSVFGIIASAFTHQPMTNALNASAAAITAINDNNVRDYNRAHQAWKENMDLVVTRHNMERAAYQDAITLMNTNMVAGEAKLRMNAARFGDQKTLFLLDNGMSDEVFKVFEARDRAIVSAQEAFQRSQDMGLEQAIIQHMTPTAEQEPDPGKRIAAHIVATQVAHGLTDKAKDPRWAEYAQWVYDNTNPKEGKFPTPEERSKKLEELGFSHPYGRGAASAAVQMSPNAEIYRRALQYEEDPNHPAYGNHALAYDTASKEVKAAQTKPSTSSSSENLTTKRQIAADAAKLRKELETQEPKLSREEIDRKVDDYIRGRETRQAVISGNRKDQLTGLAERAGHATATIDKIEALLRKHNALTGLGGKLTRPGEIVGNWFGNNQTDRAQFVTLIQELREWTPRLMNESLGRPLSSEESRITEIVPGLESGATTINTAKRLLELKKLLQKMQTQWRDRAAGAPGGGSTGSSAPDTGGNWYQNVPDKRVGQ